MKKNVLYSVIICMATLLAFSSCKQPDYPMPPHISMHFSHGTGVASIPVDGTSEAVIANLVVVASTELDWTLSLENPSDASWVMLDTDLGTGSLTVNCTILANPTGAIRKAVVIAEADGFDPISCTIEQNRQ